MRDKTDARDGRPTLTWVPTVDARGRTRMEARWTAPTPAVPAIPDLPAVARAHHAA